MGEKQKYVMALDQGTTSSRCILFDHSGEICSLAQKEYTQYYPKPGWVEHNPREIWSSQLSVAIEAMAEVGATASDIAAIGITNQRETTIVWDKKTGEPVYPAIVWQCRRTADLIDNLLEKGYGEKIKEKTGLVADAYFSASKIAWILDHVEGARTRAQKGELLFGTVDTWLIWNLTRGAVHVTDYTNASRTMLFNIHEKKWDDELLQLFHIPKSMLPEVKPSSCIYGETTDLFDAPIRIAGAAGDQQAALFGQCCFQKGDVKNTYGTGAFILMHTGHQPVSSKNGLLATIAASTTNHVEYALEGSVFVAGAVIQWLRDEMRMIKNAPQSEEYARQAPEGSDEVYLVPAFTGLGAPWWNPHARGMVVGLTRGCKKEQFIRAALESIAYQSHDVIHAMQEDTGIQLGSLLVDGGASANDFLLQFQSDLAKMDVVRPGCIESTALGAAFLAGLAVGFWKDKEEISRIRKPGRAFHPQMQEADRTHLLKGWHRAVRCALFYAKETEEETGAPLLQESAGAEASPASSTDAKEDA